MLASKNGKKIVQLKLITTKVMSRSQFHCELWDGSWERGQISCCQSSRPQGVLGGLQSRCNRTTHVVSGSGHIIGSLHSSSSRLVGPRLGLVFLLRIELCVIRPAGVLLSRPETRECNFLEPRLYASFVKPSMQPTLYQLRNFGYVLQPRATAEKTSD